MGLSIKDVRSRGEGEFVQCGHLADKGGGRVLQMRTSKLFGAKNTGFFENYSVWGGGGLSQ